MSKCSLVKNNFEIVHFCCSRIHDLQRYLLVKMNFATFVTIYRLGIEIGGEEICGKCTNKRIFVLQTSRTDSSSAQDTLSTGVLVDVYRSRDVK